MGGGEVGSGHGDTSAFDALARAVGSALSVPLALISLAAPHDLQIVGTHQVEQGSSTSTRVAAPTALCRQVVRTAKPVIVHDVARRVAAGSDVIGVRDVAGYAGVPVLIGDVAVGAVAALAHRVRAWSSRDVEQLRRFADAVASVGAMNAALARERALTALLLRCAAATSVQDVLDQLAAHVGCSRAQLATAELSRIAPPVAALIGAVLRRALSTSSASRRTGELEVLALHDELTGLLNRRGFYAVAGGQLALARRKSMGGMVLFIDVDGLKHVNDRDGHPAGDTLLRLAGAVLRGTFREADTIARVGGDEFVVFSIDATDQDLGAVIDRLSSELARANEPIAATLRLRWSVGHVCFDGAGVESLDGLIAEADRRMYTRKRSAHIRSAGLAPA